MPKLTFAITVLLSLITSSVFAQSSCQDLYKVAEKACFLSDYQCGALGKCLDKRQVCPMDIDNKEGCEKLESCIEDKKISDLDKSGLYKANSRKYKKADCTYTWLNNKCFLDTIRLQFVYTTCPGRRFPGKRATNDDTAFNCEAHRDDLKHKTSACLKAKSVYENFCPTPKKILKGISCDAASREIFPKDNVGNGSESVINSDRNEKRKEERPRYLDTSSDRKKSTAK